MKKVFPILVILFIMALCLQVVINVFVKEREVEYSIKSKNDSFSIKERFVSKDSNYDFIITDKDKNMFNFFYRNNFNKQDRIIRDIKVYEESSMKCIVPIYKRDLFDNIYCTDGKGVYTYHYLKQVNYPALTNIVDKIKKDGYYKDSYNTSTNVSKEYNNNYYVGNVMPNYKVLMWNYTGLDIVTNKKVERKELLENEDLYDNDYSTMVGNYYVVLGKKPVNDVIYYNVEKYGKGTILSKETLSGNYNILGVYKNKLYLVDLDTYNEYFIDPYGTKVEKIGDKKMGYVGFKDNKLIDLDVSDFIADIDSYKLIQAIGTDNINNNFGRSDTYKVGNYYYFKTSDHNFYRSNTKYDDKPVKLFKLDFVSTWKVVDTDILVISDNMLYVYNDDYGLKPIILNNEFRYRFNNMVDIWHE